MDALRREILAPPLQVVPEEVPAVACELEIECGAGADTCRSKRGDPGPVRRGVLGPVPCVVRQNAGSIRARKPRDLSVVVGSPVCPTRRSAERIGIGERSSR